MTVLFLLITALVVALVEDKARGEEICSIVHPRPNVPHLRDDPTLYHQVFVCVCVRVCACVCACMCMRKQVCV